MRTTPLLEQLRTLAPTAPTAHLATIRDWLASHPDGDHKGLMETELSRLADCDVIDEFTNAGAAIGSLRASGVLLVPALRTAESLVLFALGATGVDPAHHRMRVGAGGPAVTKTSPLWYGGRTTPGLPTVPCWQIVAAESNWEDKLPAGFSTFDERVPTQVLDTWSDAFPGRPAPTSLPATVMELAAMLGLCSPMGERLGLRAVFDGKREGLTPSQHPLFAETRGWPVFADDALTWLECEGGLSTADAAERTRSLRASDPGVRSAALEQLPTSCADMAVLLHAFGPRLMPRSVAFAEATLAIIGARCLFADRQITMGIRQAFEAQWRLETLGRKE